MSLYLRQIKHLLPTGRAWRLTADKTLRRFFEGLASVSSEARDFVDGANRDLWPGTTRELEAWESQFAIDPGSLTDQERRDRLAAAWKATGGQSPRYIQDTIQGAGFSLFVHEWWGGDDILALSDGSTLALSDGYDLAVSGGVANPLTLLGNNLETGVTCGEPDSQCGEPEAQAGNIITGAGYALDNKRLRDDPAAVPLVPSETWPYFLYIGAETWPNVAQVPAARKAELEELCLQIRPAHMWLGMLVEYV